ncbi:sugar phosphate isomerase/epimerase [Chitinophagaceae bacterium LB-8]|uniref:Sugar phosphate isomerase/epimerase n=1 Tax=Paraflavisolibacter caeni TaxID=2982496 RepID=A0A9X2XPW5_9BACT|nr:sugar phosphate isomerase/epimerase [Paraflavisolibacter caeni]MCU7552358.1 sugar phosphate isomerase/epimerase [Paraflavisolibacter caeni]
MLATRRHFIKNVTALATGITIAPHLLSKELYKNSFEISLAEWSLHRALQGNKMSNLDFPEVAKKQFGISTVEYVNQFFKDKAKDNNYLNQLLQRCKDNGVKNHLIMIDGEGDLGETESGKRAQAIENHYKWVDAAKYLGCATIRVNAYGVGSREEVQKAAIESLSRLGEYGEKVGINIIVENHGSYSSDGQWLASVMKAVNKKNVGTLPDFGNFCVKRETGALYTGKCIEEYDRYKGVQEMLPYAKGNSAKTHDFDANGNCIETDYTRMLQIIKAAGFNGYIGIEYEGAQLSEEEGIRKTKALLEKVAATIGYGIRNKGA